MGHEINITVTDLYQGGMDDHIEKNYMSQLQGYAVEFQKVALEEINKRDPNRTKAYKHTGKGYKKPNRKIAI